VGIFIIFKKEAKLMSANISIQISQNLYEHAKQNAAIKRRTIDGQIAHCLGDNG
jgi:hypothetical protein